MSKICKCCGEEKELNDFPYHNKSKLIYRPECKVCYSENRKSRYKIPEINKKRKEVNNRSYSKHSESRKQKVVDYRKNNPEKAKLWQEKSRKKNSKLFHEFKSKLFCSNCGENHVACLDFHHVDPKEKEGLISKMIQTPQKLKKELEKCIVLCANCHRKLHYIEKDIN